MEDFIDVRSIIRKEIDNLTQLRNETEKKVKLTLEWQDYEFFKGKVQGLDIAIANLETVIWNICRLQGVEKYKK